MDEDPAIAELTEGVRRMNLPRAGPQIGTTPAGDRVFRSSHGRDNNGNLVRGPGWSPDGDTYTSLAGNVHNTANPPPGACFNCGGMHWRRDCKHSTGRLIGA
mmetsp:Transcript_86426/g.180953  ORF Transcript_86426/g.180953 Transcript_86426/m.180953 type:complete len:102 (+) Transcript_86426:593-898(+)